MIQKTLHQYYDRINKTPYTKSECIDLTSEDDESLSIVNHEDIISSILKHENTLHTRYSHKDKSFTHKGVKCGGMTYLTKKIFYSHHETSKNINTLKSRRSSKLKGTMIHRHIYHMIHCITKCDCHPVKTRKLNKIAVDAVSTLKRYGITLLDAEVSIYSKLLNSATSLDIIGYIKKNDINTPIIISIKTGYNNILFKDKTIANMDKPLTFIENNPYNHHQLQALLERYILKKEYNFIVDDFYVFYVDHTHSGEHLLHKLENWCKDDSLCEQIVHTYNNYKNTIK